mgnify:CR=1 FL=1
MKKTSRLQYREIDSYSVEIIDSEHNPNSNTFMYVAKVHSDEIKNAESFGKKGIMANLQSLTERTLTINNFEDVFCLKEFKRSELSFANGENICYIRYVDQDNNTSAIVRIDMLTKKIKMETFGSHFPMQKFITPEQIYFRAKEKAKRENWITEYGGINQFDGSVEFRYKDSDGKVIFAIITNKEGSADTVVEYEYVNNKKVRMTYTNTFAQTLTIYNQNMNLTTSIDIDSNGNILSVTSEITLT